MTQNTTNTPDEQIETAHIEAGTCGDVFDIGGSFPTQSERFRRKTGCHEVATTQVWSSTEPPENALIVAVCDEHVEDGKAFIKKKQE